MKQTTDFRYNTGATKVPWPAVGENYNVNDTVEVVKFLMRGEGAEYDALIEKLRADISALDKISTPPGKLSLGGSDAAVSYPPVFLWVVQHEAENFGSLFGDR